MKNLFWLLILILLFASAIKDFGRLSKIQYCHDFYQGRQFEFEKCMNE